MLTPPFPVAFSFNRALLMLHCLGGLFRPFCQEKREHVHNVTSHIPTSRISLRPGIQICLCLCWMTRRKHTPHVPLRVLHLVGLHRRPATDPIQIRSSDCILYPSPSVLTYCYCFNIHTIPSALAFTTVTLANFCSSNMPSLFPHQDIGNHGALSLGGSSPGSLHGCSFSSTGFLHHLCLLREALPDRSV